MFVFPVAVDALGGTMTSYWLVSYIILWLLVIVDSLVIIVLAREIEALHKHMDSLLPYLSKLHLDDRPPAE